VAPAVGPTASRRRARPWSTLLVLALLVIPLLEIVAIIGVGKVIGGWPTFFLLLFESALGAWLVRREGARSWKALSVALNTGRMPSKELADAALVLVGGTLLLTPGFLTDIVGFFFILPFTRPLARRVLEGIVAGRLLGGVFLRRFGSGAGRDGPFGPPGPGTGPGTRPGTRPGTGTRPGPSRASGGAEAAGAPKDAPRSDAFDDVIEGEIL